MKETDIVHCSFCGNQKTFGSTCCDKEDILTEEGWKELGYSSLEEYHLNRTKKSIKHCVHCGESVHWENDKFTYQCSNCSKDVCGGKTFRLDVSLSYCENCGSKVTSRDNKCSCSFLPIQDDIGFDEWKTDEEGLIKEPFNISYCKDCGVKMEEVEKYDDDVINEENGDYDLLKTIGYNGKLLECENFWGGVGKCSYVKIFTNNGKTIEIE